VVNLLKCSMDLTCSKHAKSSPGLYYGQVACLAVLNYSMDDDLAYLEPSQVQTTFVEQDHHLK
nr:hypothetical protein [Tanacetum cinerariifolium]